MINQTDREKILSEQVEIEEIYRGAQVYALAAAEICIIVGKNLHARMEKRRAFSSKLSF